MKKLLAGAAALSAFSLGGGVAGAADRLASRDLADLDLEQLTRITVTSASRREETLIEAPASLFVITQDDIRRSGATSLPEALRLAPNLQVARADTNQYAITARGSNNVLANKLLVLVDGRTVYTPLFSGVFWEAQDLVLADVERIEVISGPAGTLWGANAVNGVINIITYPASRTQGTYAYAGGGNLERGAALRHGGRFGDDGYFRVYAKYFERDGRSTDAGLAVGDDSRNLGGGTRLDWGGQKNRFMVQADAYRGEVEHGPEREYSGQSVIGRWTRELDGGSSLRAQAYFDRTTRRHENTFDETLQTFDVDVQHAWRLDAGHHVVWGGGYRASRDRVQNSPAQAFIPADRDLSWSNLFVQDEIELTPQWLLTLGTKAERNEYTGTEWLPSARVSWRPNSWSLLWSALSRAVRAPSRIDREVFFPGAPPFTLVPNPRFDAEVANVAEIGYRTQAMSNLSFSGTLFRQDYPNLRSVGLAGTAATFRNDIEMTVRGVEAWGSWRAMPNWRLSGGFVVQDIDQKVKPGALDLGGIAVIGNDPERWGQLRSSWSPRPDIDVDAAVRYVGALQSVVPAYTALDLRLAWRPVRHLELSLTAQNAGNRDYFEWQTRVLVERSVFFKVAWWP
jgi:iron complex outermembrane receptor protein